MTQSNYPPGMPPQMPPGTPPPPGGFPQGGGYSPPPAPQGNGMALASLICSLVGFCVPVLGGLLGIIFGIAGLGRAKQPGAGGKGMATTGIILGLLTVLVWGGIGGGVYWGAHKLQQMVMQNLNLIDGYLGDLSQGKIDSALQRTDGMSREEVEAQSKEVQPLGAFTSFKPSNNNQFKQNKPNNQTVEIPLSGTAQFANGTKEVDLVIVFRGSVIGKLKSVTIH